MVGFDTYSLVLPQMMFSELNIPGLSVGSGTAKVSSA